MTNSVAHSGPIGSISRVRAHRHSHHHTASEHEYGGYCWPPCHAMPCLVGISTRSRRAQDGITVEHSLTQCRHRRAQVHENTSAWVAGRATPARRRCAVCRQPRRIGVRQSVSPSAQAVRRLTAEALLAKHCSSAAGTNRVPIVCPKRARTGVHTHTSHTDARAHTHTCIHAHALAHAAHSSAHTAATPPWEGPVKPCRLSAVLVGWACARALCISSGGTGRGPTQFRASYAGRSALE